ncbi:hypothetical protein YASMINEVIRUS_1336 [Yasminevirus sp. GU-2018]|uniref:Transmembrane protein n=1 Tax=Yasminevirus sp. GU-2018 TaxID=2420051 RepID=A0A5K0UBB8_9VIRU|nr:hypothetical protein YASMINEVIRUS_1336 [Yasminevirus sp. GU-2018]
MYFILILEHIATYLHNHIMKSKNDKEMQVPNLENLAKNISIIDAIMYVLIPTPMIMFYPMIVCMALQKNFSNIISRFYLFMACFIFNVLLMPVLFPMGFFIGVILCTMLFPILLFVYIIILLSDLLGVRFPFHSQINEVKKFVPKFNIERTDYQLTEDYISDCDNDSDSSCDRNDKDGIDNDCPSKNHDKDDSDRNKFKNDSHVRKHKHQKQR